MITHPDTVEAGVLGVAGGVAQVELLAVLYGHGREDDADLDHAVQPGSST